MEGKCFLVDYRLHHSQLTILQQSHKLGLAVSIESAPEDLEEAAQRAEMTDQLPPPF
jgi:hypothetical protein